MRKEAYFALIAALLFWIQFGCQPTDFANSNVNNNETVPTDFEQSGDHTVLMGSFNIKQFGRAKLGNSDVMDILVDITRRFDLLAIQELRSTEQHIIPTFLQLLNDNGMNYRSVVSPRLGHTSQKEQLVYIYDANKFEVISKSFVAPDPGSVMHRSAFVTSFRCTETTPDKAFTFTLLNVHVDPDEVRTEIPALQPIVQNVVNNITNEDDFIVIGDFNVTPDDLLVMPMVTNLRTVVPTSISTKTRNTGCVDNLVFDTEATLEYRANGGVLNLMSEYNLSLEQALLVSDHMPVWAEFSIYETLPTTIASPSQPEIRR